MTHNRKSFISVFQKCSASINKTFILVGGWALGYHSRQFRHFPDISWSPGILSLFFFCVWASWPPQFRSAIVRQLVRQLLNTMFISNNRPSLHLWWKENLVKHRKVSKYYETDCRLVRICISQWWCWLFLFLTQNTISGQIWLKKTKFPV